MIKINRSSKPEINTQFNCLSGNNREIIKKELIKDTNDCCSFCGESDISTGSGEIEHFMPKAHFPSKKCDWENLFWSCRNCNNTKGNKFFGKGEDDTVGSLANKPLKFDEPDYKFHDWFDIDNFSGDIVELHKDIDENKYQREMITIKLFGLNKGTRPSIRLKEMQKYRKNTKLIELAKYRKLIRHYFEDI